MTREKIEERLQALIAQEEQLRANLHALQGAQLDCRYWLEEMDRTDRPEESPDVEAGQ